jgi:hypothetical protein
MKTFFRPIGLSFSVVSLLFMISCKKEVADVVTYELTLSATKSTNGAATFTEIKYTDGNKAVQTITNSTSDFNTKFVITTSFPISFSVKGTATGGSPTALPTPNISYKVEKVTNGTTREAMCSEFAASISGSGTNYTFEKVYSKVFSGTDCK